MRAKLQIRRRDRRARRGASEYQGDRPIGEACGLRSIIENRIGHVYRLISLNT